MMNNQLDIYIIDNILSYLKINEIIFINKTYYNNAKKQIKLYKFKIVNFYIYHKVRLNMEFEFYENINAIRGYYILYYPLRYKIGFMSLALVKIRNIMTFSTYEILMQYYNQLMNELNSIETQSNELHSIDTQSNKIINKYFKLYIKQLNRQQLVYLGW